MTEIPNINTLKSAYRSAYMSFEDKVAQEITRLTDFGYTQCTIKYVNHSFAKKVVQKLELLGYNIVWKNPDNHSDDMADKYFIIFWEHLLN